MTAPAGTPGPTARKPASRFPLAPRGLVWLTLRLHRSALWGWAAFSVVAVAGLLYLQDQVAATATVDGCGPDGELPCPSVGTSLLFDLYGVSFVVLPFVVAVFTASALVARDLEDGTALLGWTQSVTPVRWLAVRLSVAALPVVAVAALLSYLYRRAWTTGGMELWLPWHDGGVFRAAGILGVAYTLLGVSVGALAGLVVRRALPAAGISITALLPVQFGLSAARFDLWPRDHASSDDLAGLTYPVHGEYSLVFEGGRVQADEGCVGSSAASLRPELCLDAEKAVDFFGEIHPGSHFWPLQFVEAGIVLVLAVSAAAAAFWLLRYAHTAPAGPSAPAAPDAYGDAPAGGEPGTWESDAGEPGTWESDAGEPGTLLPGASKPGDEAAPREPHEPPEAEGTAAGPPAPSRLRADDAEGASWIGEEPAAAPSRPGSSAASWGDGDGREAPPFRTGLDELVSRFRLRWSPLNAPVAPDGTQGPPLPFAAARSAFRAVAGLHLPALRTWACVSVFTALICVVIGLQGQFDEWLQKCNARGASACMDMSEEAAHDFGVSLEFPAGILYAVPFAVAMWVAAGLVAREFQSGTVTLAWTQSLTPTRWLAGKAGVCAAVVAAGTALPAVLFRRAGDVAPAVRDQYWHEETLFHAGLVAVGYALFAVAAGVFAGVLLRRGVTAALLASALVAVPYVAFGKFWQNLWPTDRAVGYEISDSRSDYEVDRGTIPGRLVDRDFCDPAATPDCEVYQEDAEYAFVDMHPPSHYWPIQIVETGILLAAAALLTFAAFALLRRRTR